MKFKILISFFILFGSAFQQLSAQKLGYINSALIIQEHPKVSDANTQLENFQKMLADSFSIQVKAFEAKYKAFLEASNSGTLSPLASQTQQNDLRTEQQSLATEEEQLQFRVLQKREELLKPILSEVDMIIQAIGKEGNYTMIFDTSVAGAILFADQADDITEMVKTRCMSK